MMMEKGGVGLFDGPEYAGERGAASGHARRGCPLFHPEIWPGRVGLRPPTTDTD